jgi:DNA-directed RNA polymerase sigma subunit (sigma70/sigma32)
MRSIDELQFYTEKQRDGRYIGRVQEFRDLRSRPNTSVLDAISDIFALTSERIRDIEDSRSQTRPHRTPSHQL